MQKKKTRILKHLSKVVKENFTGFLAKQFQFERVNGPIMKSFSWYRKTLKLS